MIIIDTGPIVAASSAKDPDCERSLGALGSLREPPAISPFVVTEVCYFLATRATAADESAFLRSLAAGTFRLIDLLAEDIERSADLVDQYADLPLGAADASVIALAERLNITTVLTLDERHFRVVRPRHIECFELLPL